LYPVDRGRHDAAVFPSSSGPGGYTGGTCPAPPVPQSLRTRPRPMPRWPCSPHL